MRRLKEAAWLSSANMASFPEVEEVLDIKRVLFLLYFSFSQFLITLIFILQ
jgi:hypothetical protein